MPVTIYIRSGQGWPTEFIKLSLSRFNTRLEVSLSPGKAVENYHWQLSGHNRFLDPQPERSRCMNE